FARRARELGARIVEGVDVTAIDLERAQVRGVRTSQGAITAPIVINAAGPVPLTTDRASGFYFRKEMEQLLLSPGDVEDIGEDFTVPVDRARIDETVEKALHRIPIVEKARIAGGWAGLRPLTPDDHAIIGWAPGVAGFFVAVGFG